jgi:hypothetical protein
MHRSTFRHLGLAAATLLLCALVVHWSWNTLVVSVFALKAITYAQALALVLLVGVGAFLARGFGTHRVPGR